MPLSGDPLADYRADVEQMQDQQVCVCACECACVSVRPGVLSGAAPRPLRMLSRVLVSPAHPEQDHVPGLRAADKQRLAHYGQARIADKHALQMSMLHVADKQKLGRAL